MWNVKSENVPHVQNNVTIASSNLTENIFLLLAI